MITSKHKAYMLVLVTFLFGVVVGASGQYLFSKSQAPVQIKTVKELTDELDQVLHLDPSQKSEVSKILEDAYRQHDEVKNEARPKHANIRTATRKRIGDLLREEQKVAYEKWTRELDAKREKMAAEENKK